MAYKNKNTSAGGEKNKNRAGTVNLRAVVLEMLLMMEQETQYANRLLKATLDKYDYLDAQDKAFMKRLFEGCTERRLQLDYVINCYSKTKTDKMKPVILEVLRMGTYQILYMDAVPDSAACDESVKLVVKRGFSGLRGFVNGVLRTIAREKDGIKWPDEEAAPVHAMSVRYSMPEWIVSMFIKEHGEDSTKQMLAAFLQELPVTVRMDENLPKEQEKQILQKISEAGIRIEQHPYLPYAYRIKNVSGLHRLPGFYEGVFQVQDVSSMLVSEIAGIRPGMTVIDVCAAPGGKSLHAACKLNGTGLVSARDLTPEKTELIRQNAARSGYHNIEILEQDARQLRTEDVERADIVYVDAPCSGLGIMGKKCDIRYHMSASQMQEIVLLQREILKTAVRYVRPGGTLIYSTCTIHRAENEEQVHFIESLGFEQEDLWKYLPEKTAELIRKASEMTGKQDPGNEKAEKDNCGCLQLLPGMHETDGFFMARLRKKEQ